MSTDATMIGHRSAIRPFVRSRPWHNSRQYSQSQHHLKQNVALADISRQSGKAAINHFWGNVVPVINGDRDTKLAPVGEFREQLQMQR